MEKNLYVSAYVYNICSPLNGKQIDVAKQSYDHLKEIKLADSNPYNSDLEVDILISGSFYWNFICDSFVRDNSGPTAFVNQSWICFEWAYRRSYKQCSFKFN